MGFRYMEKKYYGWRGGKNNRFLHDFYIYDLRHNSSDKKWQSLGCLFSFNFMGSSTIGDNHLVTVHLVTNR